MRPVVLVVHILSGSAGLVLGPLALLAPERHRWSLRAGAAYELTVAVLCTSAVWLVALQPELWGLGLIAVATEGAAMAGGQARRRERPGWRSRHVRLMAGSYVSLVTAFLVVNTSSPVIWFLPTVIGSPLIARAAKRASTTGSPTRRSPVRHQ